MISDTAQKPKILIVDDDPILPTIIKESSLMVRYQFVSIQDSLQTMAAIESERPALILLDFNMPEMNGLEVCHLIRRDPRWADIPIIFLTGITETKEMVKAFQAGAVDYIIKPVVLEELSIKFETRLELYQSRQKLQEYARNMERLAAERAKQLIHFDRLATLGTLSAGLAHEIKNPTTFISGNVQTLEKFWQVLKKHIEESRASDDNDQLDFIFEEMPDLIDGMKDGVSRVCKVVDSLKSFSRKESLSSKAFVVSESIQKALTLCSKKIKNQVEVEEHYSDNDIMISGDAQQIEQVFTNLIINASDALEGQPDARIVFKVESNKGSVSISCQDNGPGIPPEKLKSMWDPFFTTKPAGKGTGLGLSICRSIIECHDGSITVENVPEGGLKFNITLPLYTGE